MWALSLAGTSRETEMIAGGDVFHHWHFTHEKTFNWDVAIQRCAYQPLLAFNKAVFLTTG